MISPVASPANRIDDDISILFYSLYMIEHPLKMPRKAWSRHDNEVFD